MSNQDGKAEKGEPLPYHDEFETWRKGITRGKNTCVADLYNYFVENILPTPPADSREGEDAGKILYPLELQMLIIDYTAWLESMIVHVKKSLRPQIIEKIKELGQYKFAQSPAPVIEGVEEAAKDRGCPCKYLDEPCHQYCTCKNGAYSHGCLYCATYGSLEQRKEKAKRISEWIKLGVAQSSQPTEVRIEYYMREGLIPNNEWKLIDKDWYDLIRPDYRKMVSVPVAASQPTEGQDWDLIGGAVNNYYHEALRELDKKDLGDIERRNWEKVAKKCERFFAPQSSLPQPGQEEMWASLIQDFALINQTINVYDQMELLEELKLKYHLTKHQKK